MEHTPGEDLPTRIRDLINQAPDVIEIVKRVPADYIYQRQLNGDHEHGEAPQCL